MDLAEVKIVILLLSWQPMTLNPCAADIEQINEIAQFYLENASHVVKVFPIKREAQRLLN